MMIIIILLHFNMSKFNTLLAMFKKIYMIACFPVAFSNIFSHRFLLFAIANLNNIELKKNSELMKIDISLLH